MPFASAQACGLCLCANLRATVTAVVADSFQLNAQDCWPVAVNLALSFTCADYLQLTFELKSVFTVTAGADGSSSANIEFSGLLSKKGQGLLPSGF